jgi:hypothetical protein
MLFSKKIKTILFLSLSAATAVPFLLCTTSCSSIDSVNIKILNSNSSGQKYNQLQNAPSISKLLYGDKNFYGGNYVLIIGCDGGQTTDYSDYGHLLFNNTSTFDYNNQIVGSQVITDSFEKLLNDDFTKNIGIATYGIPAVEIESYTSTDRHETVYANPWCV